MTHKAGKQDERAWNRFYITYNPHFKEFHAIRTVSGCSAFSSKSYKDVVKWIEEKRKPIQLDLFEW
jgi:hypothetical protein